MKRLFAYLLILVMLLALVGCNNTPTPKETTPEQTPTNGTTPEETTPEITTPPEGQPDSPLKEIYNIVDRTGLQDIPTDDALECFYTDETFEYFFSSIKSEYVMVYYTDGTSENVKVALEQGHITVADLKKFDIWYRREVRDDLPKLTMTALRELIATYGENLTWEHFEQYYFVETGSGLYIRIYPINEEYELWIGGGNPPSNPDYIYLTKANIMDGETFDPIDVRYESIEDLLNPTGLAQILVDYEIELKEQTDALREEYPHRIYYFHPISHICCMYFLEDNTTAEAIVRKHNMENVFSNAEVSAYNKTRMIFVCFDRDNFTEEVYKKLEKIKDDESAIRSFMFDMSRSIAEHFVPRIDYYTDHAVPLEHVATLGSHWYYEGEDMIFKTKAEYDAYLDDLSKYANYDYEVNKIAEWRELYNEAFFEENALILTTIFSGSSSIGKKVDNLYVSDNTVYVVIETEIPTVNTEDIVWRYFTIQVPKSEVANVDEVISVR